MGIRQKLGLSKSKSSGSNNIKQPSGLLKKWFCNGKLSATDVQKMAGAAHHRKPSDEQLLGKMAKVGAWGSVRGNASRDLCTTLSHETNSAPIYSAKIALWDVKLDERVYDDCFMNLPFEVLDAEIEQTMTEQGLVEPNIDDWTSLPANSPHIATKRTLMEDLNVDGDGKDFVCCGLWGDGAVYHTRDSLNMLLFNVLSGIFHQRFWIACHSKRQACQCGCKGLCTVESLWAVLSWVQSVWSSGLWPLYRHDGIPFSENKLPGDKARAAKAKARKRFHVKGGFMQKRADWSWLKSIVHLMGWKGEGILQYCCYKCRANHTTIPYDDPSVNGLWRLHPLTHAVFIQTCFLAGRKISGLFDIPGMRLEHISIDLMHCGDLGLLIYVQGQMLFDLLWQWVGSYQIPRRPCLNF